jgi:anti-sigma factor RsiW
MPNDDFEELLGVYALHVCDAAEEAAVTRHLVGCPRCRAELASHEEVAGVLGNLGGAAPDGLWDRIWGEIASPDQKEETWAAGGTAGASRLPRSSAHPPPPFAVLDPGPGDGAKPPTEDAGAAVTSEALRRARRRWAYTLAAGAVAAALAVVVGLLGTTVGNLNHQVSALNRALVTGGVRGAEQAAVADPNHKAVQLLSSTGPWKAQLVTLPSGTAFIVPEKMPSISASSTFQAWAIVRGKIVSLGVLGRSGQIHQLLLEPNMTAVLVNTEPLGGTSQPTAPVLLKGALPTTL